MMGGYDEQGRIESGVFLFLGEVGLDGEGLDEEHAQRTPSFFEVVWYFGLFFDGLVVMPVGGGGGSVVVGQFFLLFLVRGLCIVEQFHFCTVQTLVECIFDGLALVESSIGIIETVSLLLLTLSTCLLLVLQLAQQLFQFANFLQLSLPAVSKLLVFIVQLRDLPSQCLVLCGQIGYFGIELVDLPLQVQVFLFGLDVLLHIEFFEPSVGTVDGGLAGMEGIGGDAFGSGRDALFLLFGLAGYVSAGSGWLLPLQFPDCLQELPIESAHILIGVVFSEMLDITPYFFEGDAYFLGDVDYQSLPHLQQLPILAYRLFLKVLVPLLQCLFEDEQ